MPEISNVIHKTIQYLFNEVDWRQKGIEAAAALSWGRFASITPTDMMSFAEKMLACISGALLLYWAYRRDRKKNKNLDIEKQNRELDRQIKEQELFDLIQSNKKKHG